MNVRFLLQRIHTCDPNLPLDMYYVRYIHDIVALTKSRRQLRLVVRTLKQTFIELKVSQYPDKTFIGRIEQGFDFLRYHLDHYGLKVAEATIRKFAERATRLYEQERERPGGPSLLGVYFTRWVGWATVGEPCAREKLVDGGPGILLRQDR